MAWLLAIGLASLCCSLSLQPVAGQSCDSSCQQTQRDALASFYGQLGGPGWTNSSGWNAAPTTTVTEHCGWAGVHCCTSQLVLADSPFSVSCRVAGGVSALLLPRNNLTGSIPQAVLAALSPSLELLDLQGNALTGSIPAALGACSLLNTLYLSQNALQGTLPATLFQLSLLSSLDVAANKLTGTLPTLGALTSMRRFVASNNDLTGQLPLDWYTLPALSLFDVEANSLTGTIPAGAATPELSSLQMSSALQRMGPSLTARMAANQLTGSLPLGLAMLPIQELDVSHNNLTGTVTALLSAAPNLNRARLGNNQLTGMLPATFASQDIRAFYINDNMLTGELPAAFGDQIDLRQLVLKNNNFSGGLPESMSRLQFLELFRFENSGLRTTVQNSRGEWLPEWAMFASEVNDRQMMVMVLPQQFLCSNIVIDTTTFPMVTDDGVFQLSPDFFKYQNCSCAATFVEGWQKDGTVMTCDPQPPGNNHTTLVLLVVVPTATAAVVVLAVVIHLMRTQLVAYASQWAKKRGPPGAGKMVTLVATDVEGSTELWEWNHEAMNEAIDVHDRVMRSQLNKFHGYEVTTEGDAFLLAFHEPSDAVAWAVAVQQALLTAKWPTDLQYHPRSCIRRFPHAAVPQNSIDQAGALDDDAASQGIAAVHPATPKVSFAPTAPTEATTAASEVSVQIADEEEGTLFTELQEVDPRDVAFRGLSVRMGIATGQVQSTHVHHLSMRTEYEGPVVNLLHAIADCPSGGQIIVESQTFTGINSQLNDIPLRLPPHPDYNALTQQVRAQQSGHSIAASLSRLALHPSASKLMNGQTGQKMLPLGRTASAASSVLERNGTNQQLGVTTSVATNAPSEFVSGFATKSELPVKGGSVFMRWLRGRMDAEGEAQQQSSLMVMDMGLHVLKELDEPKQLHQILVPGLEERARMHPLISTVEQLAPGYFDAPGALDAPLSASVKGGDLPDVTLCFCTIDGLKSMQTLSETASEQALTLYRDCVRRILRSKAGYECQEAEGSFMLAFQRPIDALQFCLLTQEALCEVHWGDDVLALPPCKTIVGDQSNLLFRGPKAKMGVYEGVPTRVVPHTTTGRADYFGPLVNRAARFCNGAAHGGQVVAPGEVVRKVVASWICRECPDPPEDGRPLLLQALVASPDKNATEPPAPPILAEAPLANLSSSLRRALGKPADPAADPVGHWVMHQNALVGITPPESPASGGMKRLDALDLASSSASPLLSAAAENTRPSTGTASRLGLVSLQANARHSADGALAPEDSDVAHRIMDQMNNWPAAAPAAASPGKNARRDSPVGVKPGAPRHTLDSPTSTNSGAMRTTLDGSSRRATASLDMAGFRKDSNGNPLQLRTSATGEPQRAHGGGDEAEFAPPAELLARHLSVNRSQHRRRSSAMTTRRTSVTSDGSHYVERDPWRHIKQVDISHVGQIRFKGVIGVQTVMQLSSGRLNTRTFPNKPPSIKAEMVSPGRGLLFVVMMPDEEHDHMSREPFPIVQDLDLP